MRCGCNDYSIRNVGGNSERYPKLEIRDAKYYAVILDSTPDASHKEQTTFILRYVSAVPRIADTVRVFEIQERFMTFMDAC